MFFLDTVLIVTLPKPSGAVVQKPDEFIFAKIKKEWIQKVKQLPPKRQ